MFASNSSNASDDFEMVENWREKRKTQKIIVSINEIGIYVIEKHKKILEKLLQLHYTLTKRTNCTHSKNTKDINRVYKLDGWKRKWDDQYLINGK